MLVEGCFSARLRLGAGVSPGPGSVTADLDLLTNLAVGRNTAGLLLDSRGGPASMVSLPGTSSVDLLCRLANHHLRCLRDGDARRHALSIHRSRALRTIDCVLRRQVGLRLVPMLNVRRTARLFHH